MLWPKWPMKKNTIPTSIFATTKCDWYSQRTAKAGCQSLILGWPKELIRWRNSHWEIPNPNVQSPRKPQTPIGKNESASGRLFRICSFETYLKFRYWNLDLLLMAVVLRQRR